MDHWAMRGLRPEHNGKPAHHSRILTNISGNAQHFVAESKSHLDFSKPIFNATRAVSEPGFPLPISTLGSNDRQAFNDRLAARKARRSSHPHQRRMIHDRPYLNHEKYLSYRERKRFDTGKDDKPVWSDEIEESFQNALAQIPPMGRKKKTQYGRPHGRNELIAEWIFQETGEKRCRKQVSSHIQVLSNLLRDVPEWKALTAGENSEDDDIRTEAGHSYYYESIADQVRLQRQMLREAKAKANGGITPWFDFEDQQHSISKVTFEMWVGMPDKVRNALHNYTRIQSNQSTLPAAPLENCKDWRSLFPDLEPILRSTPNEEFDIVFLKSRFSLLTDFPPLTSKLGLVLDLDFRDPQRPRELHGLSYFSSINYMYHNGKGFCKTEHKNYQAADPGVVHLFFEAEWWATQFTELTRKRRDAENTQNNNAVQLADDYSRGLFRGLTVMQDVFAIPSPSDVSSRKRVAVLLWVFAQTSRKSVGVTTWQKVVPPPNRLATNSSTSTSIDASLPQLAMDSMMEDSFGTDMMDDDFGQQGITSQLPMSPIVYEPGAYHSGFTPMQGMTADQLKTYDFSTSTGFTPIVESFVNIKQEPFDFAMPLPMDGTVMPSQHTAHTSGPISSMFDLPQHTFFNAHNTVVPVPYHISIASSTQQPHRHDSLRNFDMSTHDMLQAQLGDSFDGASGYQTQILTPRPQTDQGSQRLMIGHVNDLDLLEGEEQLSQAMLANRDVEIHDKNVVEHPAAYVLPKVARPPLMAHHSFAGVIHTHADELEPLVLDTPARTEFAHLVNSHFEPPGDDDDSNNNDAIMGHMQYAGNLTRPRSQPVLSSSEETLGFDTPARMQSAFPEIKGQCDIAFVGEAEAEAVQRESGGSIV